MPAIIEANEHGLEINGSTIFWDGIIRTTVSKTQAENPEYKQWCKDVGSDLKHARAKLDDYISARKKRDEAVTQKLFSGSELKKASPIYRKVTRGGFWPTFLAVLGAGAFMWFLMIGMGFDSLKHTTMKHLNDHPIAMMVYFLSAAFVIYLGLDDITPWKKYYELHPQGAESVGPDEGLYSRDVERTYSSAEYTFRRLNNPIGFDLYGDIKLAESLRDKMAAREADSPAYKVDQYRLAIITSSGTVDVISSFNLDVINQIVKGIGAGKKNAKGNSFTVVQKDGDYIVNNNQIDNVDLSQNTQLNIDNATNYYKTEHHGFSAEQVQEIIGSIVPSIQSLESAIAAHKEQSSESSADVAELAAAIQGIKELLAKAPETFEDQENAKNLVQSFKDKIDNCSRLQSIYNIGCTVKDSLESFVVQFGPSLA